MQRRKKGHARADGQLPDKGAPALRGGTLNKKGKAPRGARVTPC